MKIALFITCLADALYPDLGRPTTRLLERLGHTGYQPDALPLVRHFVDTFEPYEAIVAPSGSCVDSVCLLATVCR